MPASEQTVSFVVIDVSDHFEGLGKKHFRIAPRTGDHITIPDDDGIAQNYQVVAVIHPSEPTVTAGDLIVRHTGTDVEFRESLKEGEFFGF